MLQVQRLRSTEAAANQEHVLHQATVDEITAEKQRLESQLTSLNNDRVSLQEQLQEVWYCPSACSCYQFSRFMTGNLVFLQTVKLKTSAVADGERLHGDHDRLQKELDLLHQRLASATVQLDSAVSERNQFELQANKSERELKLVQEEQSVLQVCICACLEYSYLHGTFIHILQYRLTSIKAASNGRSTESVYLQQKES